MIQRRPIPDAPLFQQPKFDGATIDAAKDNERLGRQLRSVLSLMSDGKWRTPSEMEAALGANWASISARLRDARKERFGGHTVQRRRRGDGGTHEYRMEVRR